MWPSFDDIKVLSNKIYGTSIWSLKFNENDYVNVSSIFLIQNNWLLIIANNNRFRN